jgi:hypothetical protein
MKRYLLSIALLVILVANAAYGQDMGITTGNKRGTYYQFGLNLAQLLKSHNIKLNVFDSAGSVQNIYAVFKAPGVQLGIVQSDVRALQSDLRSGKPRRRTPQRPSLERRLTGSWKNVAGSRRSSSVGNAEGTQLLPRHHQFGFAFQRFSSFSTGTGP